MHSNEQFFVVEFGLVGEYVRVGVGCDREVALADLFADSGPRDARQVSERDPPVAEVVG